MNDTVNPQAIPGDGAGPGAALHAERRRQSLSLGDVSRHLKLSVRQLEALERDDFAPFGGPVFIHGFIRNYAKLLGIDAEPLVQAADVKLRPREAVEHEAAAEPAPEARAKRPNLAAAGLVAFVLVAGVVGFYASRHGRDATKPPPADVQPVAAAPSVPPPQAADEGTPQPVADAAAAQQAGGATAQPGTGEVGVLRMVFDQESWVEVTDRSGKSIFAQLNPAGARRKVTGEPPLSVVVGNAAGVRLSYNDREIDLAPHTRVDVARLTLK